MRISITKGIRLPILIAFFTLVAVFVSAQSFQHNYVPGKKLKMHTTIAEDVYRNDQFSHSSRILLQSHYNVLKKEGERSYIAGRFYLSQNSHSLGRSYALNRDYVSGFWIDKMGRYSEKTPNFMPISRDLPVFPEGVELKKGTRWSAKSYEVHDLRDQFGIAKPYEFPMTSNYSVEGMTEFESKKLQLITVKSSVNYRPDPFTARYDVFPVYISGFSEKKVYWDPQLNLPAVILEEFDITFDLSDGQTLNYRGISRSDMLGVEDIDPAELAKMLAEGLEQNPSITVIVMPDGRVKIIFEDINFGPESYQLSASEQNKLKILAETLERFKDRDLLIVGHTALAGSEEGRAKLSLDRAKIVSEFLISRGFFKAEQIIIDGKGSTEPKGDNATEEGRKQNRRVEIIINE